MDPFLMQILYTAGIAFIGFMLGRNSLNFKKRLEASVEITIDLLASKNYIRKKYENGEWYLLDIEEIWKEGYNAGCNKNVTDSKKIKKV